MPPPPHPAPYTSLNTLVAMVMVMKLLEVMTKAAMTLR